MGMIFQQFNLLMQRTALQNICFPMEIAGIRKEQAVARARELLKLVDMENKEDSYPSQLSGGQKSTGGYRPCAGHQSQGIVM